jgi:hypothetical protein
VSGTETDEKTETDERTETPTAQDIAWQNLQAAIVQERFDDLPELIPALDFAEFSAEPVERIREAIRRGDIVGARADGLVTIPKHENERLIRYRLLEDPTARIVERPANPGVRRLSTYVGQEIFDLVADLCADRGASVRQLIEEAVTARWGTDSA